MTRINAGIPPKKLIDSHLMAEHREIIRIPSLYHNRMLKGIGFNDVPKQFTLGTGHVKFFMTKGKYLCDRYFQIYEECIARGFKPTLYEEAWSPYDIYRGIHKLDYTPTTECIKAVQRRIAKNITESNQIPRYYGEKISVYTAISLLVK